MTAAGPGNETGDLRRRAGIDGPLATVRFAAGAAEWNRTLGIVVIAMGALLGVGALLGSIAVLPVASAGPLSSALLLGFYWATTVAMLVGGRLMMQGGLGMRTGHAARDADAVLDAMRIAWLGTCIAALPGVLLLVALFGATVHETLATDVTAAAPLLGAVFSPCTWIVLAPIPLAVWNWSLRRRYAFAVQRLAEERYDPDEES